MLILFDKGTPRTLTRSLVGHTVIEARAQGWDNLTNGNLLNAAEAAGFEVLITTDKRIRYQQNLSGRQISLIVLGQGRWSMIRPLVEEITAAVNAAKAGSYFEIVMPYRKAGQEPTTKSPS